MAIKDRQCLNNHLLHLNHSLHQNRPRAQHPFFRLNLQFYEVEGMIKDPLHRPLRFFDLLTKVHFPRLS
jgi:hypothetical protein